MARKRWLLLLLGGAFLVLLPARLTPVAAQSDTTAPFILPFEEPSGPDTWILGQPYGNTTGAYRQRFTTYRNAQGIHFGVDLTAPCGTEIVAMADGIVFAADNMSFGSAPHNLMIDHPQLGYATFYGHLLERPSLQPGQGVRAGQVVALSGTSGSSCNNGAHLHLEVRDLRHVWKYNPLPLIQADWDNLALTGPTGRAFQRNLEDPRQWQHLDDQPDSIIGGPLLNDFASAWPPDTRRP
jgi:murein DD-endopeptidase MepM/ murein hydrolase activator NlpD